MPRYQVAGPTPRNFISSEREKTLTGEADPSAPLPRLVPDQVRRALAASLKRLKTSYVDLYQLHWPDRYTPLWGNAQYRKEKELGHEQQERPENDTRVPFDEVVLCMGELIEAGLIKAWGLSNETSFGVCTWVEAAKRLGVPPPCSIQNDFSLCDRRFESELAETCSSVNCNLGLLAYGALNGGMLSGKYAGGQKPEGARHTLFANFQARYTFAKSLAASEKYSAIAKEAGLTPAQLALAWAYSRHYMASVIIGATKQEQLLECVMAAEIELSKATLAAIEAVHMDHRNPNLRD
jgi:aryl-alcohol dehydrogenase-like predicted oxidoreductase